MIGPAGPMGQAWPVQVVGGSSGSGVSDAAGPPGRRSVSGSSVGVSEGAGTVRDFGVFGGFAAAPVCFGVAFVAFGAFEGASVTVSVVGIVSVGAATVAALAS